MNADQPDFEPLRRLLKLKRYEQPPPRYFNDFSSKVIQRIKSGRSGAQDNLWDQLNLTAPWWQRIRSIFEPRPILTGACATALLALVVGGAVYTEKHQPTSTTGISGFEPQTMAAGVSILGGPSPLTAMAADTNSASSLTGSSLFNFPELKTQPVLGRPPGR
jgi:hypothetical protein